MDNVPAVLHSIYAILGLASIIGGLKAIDWLIGLKYMSKDECNKKFNQVYSVIDKNKDEMVEKLDRQHKEVLDKIERQNQIFATISSQIAEIAAENKIILNKLGLK